MFSSQLSFERVPALLLHIRNITTLIVADHGTSIVVGYCRRSALAVGIATVTARSICPGLPVPGVFVAIILARCARSHCGVCGLVRQSKYYY